MVSVMTLCRMLLLLEASLPPCQCKPVSTTEQSGTLNQNAISFQSSFHCLGDKFQESL